MNSRRLFTWLAAVAGYVGIGMLLGYALGDQTINTALWVGILLVVGGAVLLGMSISRGATKTSSAATDSPISSHDDMTELPK